MGAHRDEMTFALDDASRHGYEGGSGTRLAWIASDLGVDPGILDGLGNEHSLPSRVARLEAIVASVQSLLEQSRDQLELASSEEPDAVATFIIDDQLPPLDETHGWDYFHNKLVYQLDSTEDGVMVRTDLFGGPSLGPYAFAETIPLSPEWVSSRLVTRGIERDVEFCGSVVDLVVRQMMAQGEQIG